MQNVNYYLEIKGNKIPVKIRSYKKSKNINIYFKNNILNISKPIYISNKSVLKFAKENEEKINDIYQKYKKKFNEQIKLWQTGENILYKGKLYNIIRKEVKENKFCVYIDDLKEQFIISVPYGANNEEVKLNVDKIIKKIFKNNTYCIIKERLPILSKYTNIQYSLFKVREAKSRFGSCLPYKKELHFSLRLVMLPQDKIDAIIVHELCHIVYKNHNSDFYNLVRKFIPNYNKIDKWLKENGRLILF